MERLLDDVLTPLMAGRAVLRCRDGLLDVVASAGPVTDVARSAFFDDFFIEFSWRDGTMLYTGDHDLLWGRGFD